MSHNFFVVLKFKKKHSRGVRHACTCRLRTDASRNMLYTGALNTQLPCVIAERAIHLSSSNGWAEFWPEPIKFLVDMLNYAHNISII